MTVGGLGAAKPPPYEALDEGESPRNPPPEPKEPSSQPQVITQPELGSPTPARPFRKLRAFRLLVGVELAVAILMVGLGVAVVAASSHYSYNGFYFRRYTSAIGSGIWAGIYAALAAGFGAAAAARPRNRCLLMSYFVLGIIAVALFVPIVLIFASVGLDNERGNIQRAERWHRDWERAKASGRPTTEPPRGHYYGHHNFQLSQEQYDYIMPEIRGVLAVQALLVAGCLAHAAVTVASLAIVCFNWGKGHGGCCSCCGGEEAKGPIVVYVAPGTDPQQIHNAINAAKAKA